MILDPSTCLQLAREALARGDNDEAAQWFAELDAWISRGGFLPSEWSEPQRRALENTRSAGVTSAGVAPPAQSTAPTGAYDDPAVQRAIHEHLHTNPWEV